MSSQTGLLGLPRETELDSSFPKKCARLPCSPVQPYHGFSLVPACTRLGSCSSSLQVAQREPSLHIGLRLVVERKLFVESRLGPRCPVAVGWIWQWTLCEHASLFWAAGRRRGQALCNHYSSTARRSETQSNGIPSSAWVPASGLLVSGLMNEVRGTGDEGAWSRAREARKGFPEDMLLAMDTALLYVRGELVRSSVCSADLERRCSC